MGRREYKRRLAGKFAASEEGARLRAEGMGEKAKGGGAIRV